MLSKNNQPTWQILRLYILCKHPLPTPSSLSEPSQDCAVSLRGPLRLLTLRPDLGNSTCPA